MRPNVFRKTKNTGAFTLVELLVLLAIVAVLASLALPGLTRAQGQTRQAQCAGNFRQLTLAHILYGSENADRLPTVAIGNWLWDIPTSITDALGKYGAGRQQFYCPANPGQNADGLWTFTPQYRIAGCAFTLVGSASLITSNANPSITPRQVALGVLLLSAPQSARRALVADVIISQAGQNNTANKFTYSYKNVQGGYPVPHRTSHLDFRAVYPIGGNVGMLDGHVEWTSFSNVICRTTGGVPGFWW